MLAVAVAPQRELPVNDRHGLTGSKISQNCQAGIKDGTAGEYKYD